LLQFLTACGRGGRGRNALDEKRKYAGCRTEFKATAQACGEIRGVLVVYDCDLMIKVAVGASLIDLTTAVTSSLNQLYQSITPYVKEGRGVTGVGGCLEHIGEGFNFAKFVHHAGRAGKIRCI
jgi:hypothetical protein